MNPISNKPSAHIVLKEDELPKSNVRPSEFDDYATSYDAGMSHPLKRLAGVDESEFMEPKIRWLLRNLKIPRMSCPSENPLRLLEVGCGTGAFLKGLREHGFKGYLSGCDISEEMLKELQRTWQAEPVPQTALICNERLPYGDNSFDILVVCAVLHHVIPSQRPMLFSEMNRVLAPGGKLFIFEHNPWNPITQLVVKTTEIDKNAIMLSARETCLGVRKANMKVQSSEFLLFFPPRWRFLQRLDQWLSWLPFGGQYVVTAESFDHRRES